MKKIYLLLLSLLMAIGMNAQTYIAAADSYGGGDGTKGNPYLISTPGHLAKLASDMAATANFSRGKYFRMTQDITLNDNVLAGDSANMNKGTLFEQLQMIGDYTDEQNYNPFQGVFDGDGHSIRGLYLALEGNYVGLFRTIENGTVKNLGIEDSYVHGNSTVGVFSARTYGDAKIINCHAGNVKVESWGSYDGGLVGQMLKNSTLQNCYATNVRMYGKNNIGGLVGRIGNNDNAQVLVQNCYANVRIVQRKNAGAGVSSENNNGSTVTYCYYNNDLKVDVTANSGVAENNSALSAAEMQGQELVDKLNAMAETIAGACRWQKGGSSPAFDFSTFTPESEVVDINALATDPYPADKDFHAAIDNKAVTMTWTLPADGLTAAQFVYFGTDSATVASADTTAAYARLAKENSLGVSNLSSMLTYYWRVDRATAEGKLTKGTVWAFQPAHLAFPGAEGYGRFARGGRGGKVVYVTNLNNSGEGSLRWALTNGSGPRTVMFKVAGVIDQEYKTIRTDPNITIAAQTAPGKGICVYHADLGIGSDNVVRFLRARRGLGTPEQTGNALGTVYSDYSIVDHTSMSWGTDETFSSRSSKNITLQRSMIAEALGIAGHRNYSEGTNHGYAATIGGDIGSFHHNLLAGCNGRNWSMGGGANANGEYAGRLDIFNNVVYNWYGRTTDGGAHEVNFVGNYYKMGPDTKRTVLFTLNIENNLKGTQSAYISGNVRENKNGSLQTDKLNDTYRLSIDDGRASLDWNWLSTKPFFESYAKIEDAQQAFKTTLSDNGANQPLLDDHDTRMVTEALNGTYTYVGSKSGIKGEIDNEADAGGLEVYPETSWADNFDTDSDGLPDWWEEIIGTNANSAIGDFSDTNADPDGDGYTNLDDYLDFMAQPHYCVRPGEELKLDMCKYFAGFTNSPVFAVESVGENLSATVNGSVLTVRTIQKGKLSELTMTVKDAQNSTYSRRLCIAATDAEITNIASARADIESPLASFEVFTTGGAKVLSGSANGTSLRHLDLGGLASGLYIVKATDKSGRTFSAKVIKR